MKRESARKLEGKVQVAARPGVDPAEGEESTVVLRKRARSRPVPMTHGITAVLNVLEGCHHGKVFALRGGDNLLGRAQEANVQLDDHGVSRRHARLRVDVSGEVELLDLGSTNGTFVNGERISKESLKLGDRIRVGRGAVLELGQVSSADAVMPAVDAAMPAVEGPCDPLASRRREKTDPMGTNPRRPELPLVGDSDEIVGYARLLEIRRRRLGENHDSVAELFEHLGVTLHASGQVERASKCLTRALVIHQSREPPAPRSTARLLSRLAECDCALDRPLAAAARLERAERLLRTPLATPPEIASVRLLLSQVLWRLGREPETILALARRARDVLVEGGCDAHPLSHSVHAWLRHVSRGSRGRRRPAAASSANSPVPSGRSGDDPSEERR